MKKSPLEEYFGSVEDIRKARPIEIKINPSKKDIKENKKREKEMKDRQKVSDHCMHLRCNI